MSNREMNIFILRATERTLECKNIIIEYLRCKDSSSRAFSFLLFQEATISKRKASE